MTWTDVAGKIIDFLQKPNGLAALLILAVILLLAYTLPLGVVTWTSWESTNRLERAIMALGNHCSAAKEPTIAAK